jgi:4'-phosphopantetheinyl transferase EntD
MSLMISEKISARLIEEARRLGISVDALLERLIDERAPGLREQKGNPPDLPVWPVGVIGSLHRRDIYNDVP